MSGKTRSTCCCRCPKLLKVLWVLILLLLIWFLVDTTITSTIKYFWYPTETKTALVRLVETVFPAVTLCNNNRYRQSELNGTDVKLVLDAKSIDIGGLESIQKNVTYMTGRNVTQKEKSSAHRLEAMLKECKWRGQPCGHQNFSEAYTAVGNCYTFNPGTKGHSLLSVQSPGEDQGLMMILDVQQGEYSPLTKTAGFKVYIHEQGKPPWTESPSTYLTPGYHAHIGLYVTEEELLPRPYGSNCAASRVLKTYKTYSKSACLIECFEDLAIEECGCGSVDFKTTGKYCDSIDLLNCLLPFQERMRNTLHEKCHCPEECRKTTYEVSTSYSEYPSQALLMSMTRDLASGSNYKTAEKVRSNLARASVYYTTMSHTMYWSIPALTIKQLLSTLAIPFGVLFVFIILSAMLCCDVRCLWKHKEKSVVV